MAKALVVYDSATGHTEKMAMAIGEGLRQSGLDPKNISQTFVIYNASISG